MRQSAAKPPLGGSSLAETERSKSLLKQARGPGIAQSILAYLLSAGVVILITYIGSFRSERFELLPWLVCSLLVFVLGAQLRSEMQTNKRLDALLTILVRKRLFDDEVADTQLKLNDGGSSATGAQP